MKRLIIIIMMLTFAIPAFAMDASNEPEGFRGIKWETKIDDLPKDFYLVRTDSQNETTIYKKKDEKLMIGDAKIKHVEYHFYRGLFYKARVTCKTGMDYVLIVQILIASWGKPDHSIPTYAEYIWHGPKIMILTQNIANTHRIVNFTYKPISTKMIENNARKERFRRREENLKRHEERLKMKKDF